MRRVLVTGASGGIGRAIALRLSGEGWVPLVHYHRHEEAAREVAEACQGHLCPFPADLGVAEDCQKLWEWASSLGELTGLVNNAGIYSPFRFTFNRGHDEAFFSHWHRHHEVNFWGPLRLMRSFVVSAVRGARILNVCSRVGFRGEAGAAAYASSKAALINVVRSLAVELAPHGIGVFGLAPGWVETAMARPGMESRRGEILAGIPLGRVATPEDCAAAASFLMSDEASYLSGTVLDINGASYFH